MSDTIGCAVVGAGSWGILIAEAFVDLPAFRLLGVVDSNIEQASAVASRLGVEAFSSLEKVLTQEGLGAIAIATPNDLHTEHTLAALSARKHVLLEKPIALTTHDAERVRLEAEKRALVLMPDHIQRFFPPLVTIKQLVDGGVLGEILAVSVSRRDLLIRTKAWLQQRQRVGGLLYQSACHEYDFLRWLCGDPQEISCLAAPQVIAQEALDYPDTILSQIRFASGIVAHVWNCMTDPLMGYDGVVTGTEGTACFDLYGGRVRWRTLQDEEEERTWTPADQWSAPAAMAEGSMPQGEIRALRGLIRNFGNVIREIEQPIVTGTDGVRVIELAQAGYLSIVEERPVTLPLSQADRARPTYLEVPIGAKGNQN